MRINFILSRLIAFSLAFLLGILIYVFGVDFLRNGLHVDVYHTKQYSSPVLPAQCGNGIVQYPKECDAGKDNGYDTSSSLRTYLLWGKWFCSRNCMATDNFMFWEPKH